GAGPAPPAATPLTGLSPHQGFLHLLRFSPDGTMLADAGPGAGIELWDLATHELVAALPTAGWINDLAFAAGSDGLQLAAAGPTTPPTLWGVAEPVVRVHLPEFKGVPRSLAFGPEGLLAMASSAGELRLWRPGRCPTPIHDVSPARPTAVAFDDRGHLLALETGALRRFALPDLSTDACRGAALVALEPLPLPRGPEPGPRNKGAAPPNGPAAFARSADGRVLALARRSEILLLRPSEPDPPRRLSLPNGESPGPRGDAGPGPGPGPGSRPPGWRELALNPAADRLYLISRADEFTAWSLANPGPSRLNWTAPATATVMALSPDGTVLALGDRTGHVTLIDTASGATSGPLVPPAGEEGDRVSSLAFSPDGAELAVGTREQIRLWALTGPPAPRVVLPGHRGAIAAVAYDPTGHYLAAAGEDKLVEVWDLDLLHRELDALNLGW
ncbi:MAG TPA: WD40 repeat domain-containing protein, partial [Isosphaeraceae bacterium]